MKMMKKNLAAFVLTLSILAVPYLASAGTDWVVGLDGNGNITGAVGSSGTLSGGNNGSTGSAIFAPFKPSGLPEGSLLGILTNILNWLLAIFAILGIVGFVLSGAYYLLAGANEDYAKTGKKGMEYSIIGIIVGLSGYVIMVAVSRMLSASSTF